MNRDQLDDIIVPLARAAGHLDALAARADQDQHTPLAQLHRHDVAEITAILEWFRVNRECLLDIPYDALGLRD